MRGPRTHLNISTSTEKGEISKLPPWRQGKSMTKGSRFLWSGCYFWNQIDGLMLSMFELNEFKFMEYYCNTFIRVVLKIPWMVIYPMLDKLSVMWIAGSSWGFTKIFINNIIREIIHWDKLDFDPNENTARFLILPGAGSPFSLLFVCFCWKIQTNICAWVDIAWCKDAYASSNPIISLLTVTVLRSTAWRPYIPETGAIYNAAGGVFGIRLPDGAAKLNCQGNIEIVWHLWWEKYLEI